MSNDFREITQDDSVVSETKQLFRYLLAAVIRRIQNVSRLCLFIVEWRVEIRFFDIESSSDWIRKMFIVNLVDLQVQVGFSIRFN